MPTRYTLRNRKWSQLQDDIFICRDLDRGIPETIPQPDGLWTLRCLVAGPSLNAAVGAELSEVRHTESARQAFLQRLELKLGKPYIWGADGPESYDCSGFAQYALSGLGLDPPGDQTAHELFSHFGASGRGRKLEQGQAADLGDLAFFGTESRIHHVGICVDATQMIEAGGGDETTRTEEVALQQGAKVRYWPINRRSSLHAVIRPHGMPWHDAPVPAAGPAAILPDVSLSPGQLAELRRDLEALGAFRAIIDAAAAKHGTGTALIAGLGSRESAWGRSLKPTGPEGTGDFMARNPRGDRTGGLPPDGRGFGRGLLQIDWDWHPFARASGWEDPAANIHYGTALLAENLARIRADFPGMDDFAATAAALAAYNAGYEGVRKLLPAAAEVIDGITTGRNYSRDVLGRAAWFRSNGLA
ncbi:NlpC/P60 family protein (plasmid) [Skermanella mucosa]|uniref:NlpC/P60 family protein n=1 Tax=Skermanella mucosa TaxID=1789672 RepID=UPI00192BAD0D|nr:NlpC/P60 family protein [Skermanella mucosa]UEM24411.1 NlpC/P60 family protein [Skermanella mucosa]